MSCEHGNWPPCDLCDALDEAYKRGYAAAGVAAITSPQADKARGGAVGWAALGDWYNTLSHGAMYLTEGQYGDVRQAIENVLGALESLRNAQGDTASFRSLAESATPQPQGDASPESAKHWHDLYRRECRMRQDDAARYGQQMIELEALDQQPVATPQARPSDDDLWDQTLRQRDSYHDSADALASTIARITGTDIGEHSSSNFPWDNAIEAGENYASQARPDGGEIGNDELCSMLDAIIKAFPSGPFRESCRRVRQQLPNLSTPQAQPDGGEAVAWRDKCANGAWQYGPRMGADFGEDADKWPSWAVEPLYTHPAPAPDVARLVEAATRAERHLSRHERGNGWRDGEQQRLDDLRGALAPFTAAQQEES